MFAYFLNLNEVTRFPCLFIRGVEEGEWSCVL